MLELAFVLLTHANGALRRTRSPFAVVPVVLSDYGKTIPRPIHFLMGVLNITSKFEHFE
jgi:hypothetical protein